MQDKETQQAEQAEVQQACETQQQANEAAEQEVPELDLAAELKKAQEQAAENYDLYVRARAEMENVRRRSYDDVSKARKFGIEKFAESLLPVVDSMEKALEATANETGPIREGLVATHRQLVAALESNGMTWKDPVGERFDPNTMQAIAAVPNSNVEAGHVIEVFQKGWMIADRVLRPAMVAVAQ